MNGSKRIEFEIRQPAPESVAAALYVLGGLVVGWSVPRSVLVPVAVGEVAGYVVAFVAGPALLRRRTGPEQAVKQSSDEQEGRA